MTDQERTISTRWNDEFFKQKHRFFGQSWTARNFFLKKTEKYKT